MNLMRRMFGSVYCWVGLIFMLYSIARGYLELSAHLPNDLSSTIITILLFFLGGTLVGIAYWQIR